VSILTASTATTLLTVTTSDLTDVTDELACYLQVAAPFCLTLDVDHSAKQYDYALPLGKLCLLDTTLYLPPTSSVMQIESARKLTIKAALAWLKRQASKIQVETAECYYVLTLDIQLIEHNTNASTDEQGQKDTLDDLARSIHSFGAAYFMEELVIDVNAGLPVLQIFSARDWQTILATLQTPCELWQFLSYHLLKLQQSATSGVASFDNEQTLLTQFMNSEYLFIQAIATDNTLIKYAMQDAPNAALVTMSLAQRHQSLTAQMYQQHMQKAALLWAQLSAQMLEIQANKMAIKDNKNDATITIESLQWQQQLLDESFFLSHLLVRTLYQHPKQPQVIQESGYVVHQHSYSSLGRHYVMIFYGQAADGKQSKATIQPRLQQIAQDVALRLPLAELHHVIVMGVDLIANAEDTFMDIDLWIQPVTAMTQKERQLTKQLQRLGQQQRQQQDIEQAKESESLSQYKSPKMQLNISIPARNNKS
jgi:hypothetical protein